MLEPENVDCVGLPSVWIDVPPRNYVHLMVDQPAQAIPFAWMYRVVVVLKQTLNAC